MWSYAKYLPSRKKTKKWVKNASGIYVKLKAWASTGGEKQMMQYHTSNFALLYFGCDVACKDIRGEA